MSTREETKEQQEEREEREKAQKEGKLLTRDRRSLVEGWDRETEPNSQSEAERFYGWRTTEEDDGPFLCHARNLYDDNFYVVCGSKEEATEFQSDLQRRAGGLFEYRIIPLSEAQDVLDKYPATDEDEEPDVAPYTTGAERAAAERTGPGIPDNNTLDAMSRSELDQIGTELGLDPSEYKNRDEMSRALAKERNKRNKEAKENEDS